MSETRSHVRTDRFEGSGRSAAGLLGVSRSNVALRQRQSASRQRHTSVRLALTQLEREHVALLLALCELDAPAVDGADATSPELRAVLASVLRDDLRRTQYALRRAALGLYGVCEQCNHPIPARRLETQPATTRCLGCDTAHGRH